MRNLSRGILSESSKRIILNELGLRKMEQIIDYDYPEHESPNDAFFVSRAYPHEITTRAQWEVIRRRELSMPIPGITNPQNLSRLGRVAHYVRNLFY
jgi:hypothetical protein